LLGASASEIAAAFEQVCKVGLNGVAHGRFEAGCPGHLSVFWRFGDYLGIGAGAHAKVTDLAQGVITRTAKQKIPRLFQETAGTPSSWSERRVLDAKVLPREFMLNALRLYEDFQKVISRRVPVCSWTHCPATSARANAVYCNMMPEECARLSLGSGF
jgi:hypothetical protein